LALLALLERPEHAELLESKVPKDQPVSQGLLVHKGLLAIEA